MDISIYCQSYDISSSWGSWYSISSFEDLKAIYTSAKAHGVEEICTADYEGYLDYNSLGGESMLYFLYEHWTELEYIFSFEYPVEVFEFLFSFYDIQKIFDIIENFDYIEIEKEGFSSVELLAGFYFYDTLICEANSRVVKRRAEDIATSTVPEVFMRYFDYEAYDRDILFEYEVYEGKDSFYLFNLS